MKVLLVYPEYPETFWGFKHALKFISKKASFPPLGLLTVTAMLPQDWELKLIDMNIEKLTDENILWADYAFISAMSIQEESARKVIKQCQQLGAKTVAGGPLFTAKYQEFADLIDHLILNEAEITLPRFLQDLAQGTPQAIYTANENEWANMEESPAPRWNLVKRKKYASACIQFSRGCPFNCDFCDVTKLFGHRMRLKTAEQIIRELDQLRRLGWRDPVFFVDDNLIGNKRAVKEELLPAIITWMEKNNYPFRFNTQASINLADDDDLMNLMVQAGFDTVFIGIETVHEESLVECGKVQNRGRDLIACVRKIQKFGLQVQGGFIVGFDSDPLTIFDRMIFFIQKSGIVTAMVGLLNAPKGTKLYQRMVTENRILQTFTGNNTDLSINFIPQMGIEPLIKGYKNILHTIYSPKEFYDRTITFLKNFDPMPRKTRISRDYIKAFLKSIIILGIKENGRAYYWRLLSWTLFHRPRLFSLAVTLIIYGFHFRKIFETY